MRKYSLSYTTTVAESDKLKDFYVKNIKIYRDKVKPLSKQKLESDDTVKLKQSRRAWRNYWNDTCTKQYTLRTNIALRRGLNDRISTKRDLTAPETLITCFKGLLSSIREQIRNERQASRGIRMGARYMGTRYNNNVFYKKNSIMTMKGKLWRNVVNQEKKPRSLNPHVGVEIEFISSTSREGIAKALSAMGVGRYCHIKGDGSVGPNYEDCGCDPDDGHQCSEDNGHELTVIAEQDTIQSVITKVCTVLDNVDAYVNKTCGLHVHLDLRNRDRHIVFKNFIASQSILYRMVAKSRRKNSFCKPLRNVHEWGEGSPNDRYRGINRASYAKFQTLEIRIHSGTVNELKINNWIALLTAIADKRELMKPTYRIPKLGMQLALPSHLVEYMEARSNEFYPRKLKLTNDTIPF